MEIYYIDKEEFFKTYDTDFLQKFADGKEFKSTKRFIEYTIGRYLVKTVGKEKYNLKDTSIIIKNEKPEFEDGGIKFSISHSGKYIAAAFDKAECGLDIEEIKPRDLLGLSKRYDKNFETLNDFYKFWTEYEAAIKLQRKFNGIYSDVFMDNYILTILSERQIRNIEIINYLNKWNPVA